MYERSNYMLLLQNTYENLLANFAQSHVRNIKRALKQGNMVKKNIPLKDVISLAQRTN